MSELPHRARELEGGEARLYLTGATERRLEVSLGDRLFEAHWDPRQTGTVLYVVLDRFTRPSSPMNEEERSRVLDGLWLLAPDTGGMRSILEWRADLAVDVARRWDRPADGFLVGVASRKLSYLELDRTLISTYVDLPERSSDGDRALEIDLAETSWELPERRRLTGEERDRVRLRIASLDRDDLYVSDYPCQYRVFDRERA